MPRAKKLDPSAVQRRLLQVKLWLSELRDATPTAAKDLRRAMGEEIDDLIGELRQ